VVQVEVTNSEFLGYHSLLFFEIANTSFVAKLRKNFNHLVGRSVELYIDMDRVHFFDPVSEKRIRLEGGK
jgi:multiple sugar transport system ATP-binding protein